MIENGEIQRILQIIRFLPAFVGQIRTFCWLNCWIYMFAGPSSHLCWLCPHCRWQTQGFQSLNMPMITVISPRNLGDMWWISGRTHLCSFLRPLRALHSAMDAMDRAGDWYIKLVIPTSPGQAVFAPLGRSGPPGHRSNQRRPFWSQAQRRDRQTAQRTAASKGIVCNRLEPLKVTLN